jgi:eukaryotic-like serine/threonine-protein kinase
MTPERWQQIKLVYEQVDGSPPAARPALLDRLCGEDQELRVGVERLLGDDDAGTFVKDIVGNVAAQMTANTRLPAGHMIGPYRAVGLIGEGGMGEIYCAEDPRLGRQVALKLLPAPALQNSSSVQRFQQEARAISALNHPNIITIHDFGQTDGVYYIATELVQGSTLRAMMAGNKVSMPEILGIAIQIGSALAAAQAAGIVHRDIKPENIMVRPDGYVKVLDFGVAKLCERPNFLTSPAITLSIPGTLVGTVRYMSPEQARGLEIDSRSDLFSLGVVLYELANQRHPFHGDTAADVISSVLDREAPPFSKSSELSGQFEAIVRKCLRKERELRYQTAEDLLADLRQLKKDLETSPGTAPIPVRETWTRRRRLLVVSAVLTVAAGVYGGVRWARLGGTDWYRASRLSRIPGSSLSSSGVLSPDGRYVAYVILAPNGNRSLNLRLLAAPSAIELAPAALVTYTALAFSEDGNYLYYVSQKAKSGTPPALFRAPVLGGAPQKVVDDVSGKIALSPDGSSLAFVRGTPGEGTLWIAAPDGSRQRELMHRRAHFPFYSIAWSVDSKEIFFVETQQSSAGMDCRIFSLRRGGGEPRQVARLGNNFIYDLVPLPDSSGFLANAFDSQAGLQQIWHVAHDGTMRHITHDLSQYQGLSATKDGHRILSNQVVRHSELWTVKRDDPASARQITEPGRRYDSPTWAHDGSIISVRSEPGNSMLWRIGADGTDRPLTQQSKGDIEPHACTDRNDVVFSSDKSGAYGIWRILPDGSGLKQLTAGANDRYAQCVAGGIVLYWVQTGNQKTGMQVPLDGGPATASGALTSNQLVSPDGRLVLAPYTDDQTHQRRMAVKTRDLSTTLGTFPYGGRTAAWAPDSKGYADARGAGFAQEIWYQPAPQGEAKQLTKFGDDAIFDVSWSPDGQKLVCARGRFVSDLVLIENAKN